jgi:hypothetical protein
MSVSDLATGEIAGLASPVPPPHTRRLQHSLDHEPRRQRRDLLRPLAVVPRGSVDKALGRCRRRRQPGRPGESAVLVPSTSARAEAPSPPRRDSHPPERNLTAEAVLTVSKWRSPGRTERAGCHGAHSSLPFQDHFTSCCSDSFLGTVIRNANGPASYVVRTALRFVPGVAKWPQPCAGRRSQPLTSESRDGSDRPAICQIAGLDGVKGGLLTHKRLTEYSHCNARKFVTRLAEARVPISAAVGAVLHIISMPSRGTRWRLRCQMSTLIRR